jgi:hypothetical protein
MNSTSPLGISKLFALGLASTITVASADPVPNQGSWESTLHARDIDRDGVTDAFFDSALEITWLANWNTAGPLDWIQAKAWALSLNVFGVTGWRLPSIFDKSQVDCSFSGTPNGKCGYNPSPASSELAHMFYVTLGNLARCAPNDGNCSSGEQVGWGLSNTAKFSGMQGYYFLDSEFIPDPLSPSPGLAWSFYAYDGFQGAISQHTAIWAVAVKNGDIQPVPEPSTFLLMLAGGAIAILKSKRGGEFSVRRGLALTNG